jgi:hypothetical protein
MLEDAVKTIEQAVRCDPNNLEIWHDYGCIRYQRNEFKVALMIFKQVGV